MLDILRTMSASNVEEVRLAADAKGNLVSKIDELVKLAKSYCILDGLDKVPGYMDIEVCLEDS
jgi:hypothetical protein